MLTLNDGRAELWQWDTGRTLAVDADCSQVHFSNKVFGRSIDVDVIDGAAAIPDILLQTDKDLNVWAFVGTAENGYTKISKTFKVNRRNKPADYVFTPTDQMTLQTIQRQIGDLADLTTETKDTLVAAINEAAQTGSGGGSTVELDTTLTQSGQAADAAVVGNRFSSLSEEIANLQTSGLTTAQVKALDGMFRVAAYIKADVSAEYTAFKTAFGISEVVTLSSISATYSGGSVPVGTALDDLTGIVVTAHYSDGTSETVTGYTLSGTLTEGTSTITVSYGGKTDTFDVTVTHQNDTTAEIATEGYVFTSLGNHTLRENGGITVKYQLDAPTTVLHPAGIIPVLFSGVNFIGNLTIYKDDTYVNYVSEYENNSAGRWGQLASGELAEYNSKSWNVAEYNQISFSVDMRCIDNAYMYDYTSGQVWFAGRNTPYYGKTNISEVVT